MEPLSSYLTLLADQILIPAATLSELPDLNIEPAKVHQLILDYVFDQDCPGALASLQRELTRATRRQHLNHGSSRIVQLISKGLVYEKNRPRLDLILKGCDAIMKALEKLPPVPDQTPHPSSSKPQAMAQHPGNVPISREDQIPAVPIPNPSSVPWSAAPSVDHKYSQSLIPNHSSLAARSTLSHPLHSNSLQLTNQPGLNSPSPATHLPGPSSERPHDRPPSVRPGFGLPNKPVLPPTDHHTSRPPSPRTHPRISISLSNPVITPKPLEQASCPTETLSTHQQANQQDLHRSEEPVQSTSVGSTFHLPLDPYFILNARLPDESLSLGICEWRTIGDSDEIMYLASVGPSPRSIPVVIDDNDESTSRRSRSPIPEQAIIKLEEPDESQTGFNQVASMGSKKRPHPIFQPNIDPQLAALEDQPTPGRKKPRQAPLGSPQASPSYSDNMVLETPTLPSWPRGLSVQQQQEGELMMPGTPPELMSPYLDGCPIAEDGLTKSENEFGGGEGGGVGDVGGSKGEGQRPRLVSEMGSPIIRSGCEGGAKPEGERQRQMSDVHLAPSEAREQAVRNDSSAEDVRASDVAEVRVAVDACQDGGKGTDDQVCETAEGKQDHRLEPEAGPIASPAAQLHTGSGVGRAGKDGAEVGRGTDHTNTEPVGSASGAGTGTGTGEMFGLSPAEVTREVDSSVEATYAADLKPEPMGSGAEAATGEPGPHPAEPTPAVDSSTEAAQTPDPNPEPLGSSADEPNEPSGQLSNTRPSSASTLSTLEELRAKLIASRKGRLKTGSPSLGPSSVSGGPSGAVQVLEQNLRAQLKIRRVGSPGSQKSVAGGAGGPATDDMEDGQITTPPPDEPRVAEQSKPLDVVALPTVHPLPSKPDFPPAAAHPRTYKTGAFGSGLGAQRPGGRGCAPMAPIGCPIPGLSIGSPSFGQIMPGQFGALGMGAQGLMKPAEIGSSAGAWADPSEPVTTPGAWAGNSEPVAFPGRWAGSGSSESATAAGEWAGKSEAAAVAGAWAGKSEPITTAGGGEGWLKPESEEAGATGQARLTPRPPDQVLLPGSSHLLPSCSSSSSMSLHPGTIRLVCTSPGAHLQAERKAKEHSPSDSLQLAALREREAVLAAELVKKRMDLKIALGGPVAVGGGAKVKGKGVGCSNSSSSSSTSVSGGGGGTGEQEKESGSKVTRVAFDWAKRLDRPNAIETCSPAKKVNDESESVEEFFTDLQK